MEILAYLHTALLVSDLARARHFYETVLGLTPAERPLNFAGIWYQIGAYQVHLITTPAVKDDLVDPERWGRNRHLAFYVKDIEQTKQHLIAHNCPLQMSASGRAALFVRDPDGHVIELSESPPNLPA